MKRVGSKGGVIIVTLKDTKGIKIPLEKIRKVRGIVQLIFL